MKIVGRLLVVFCALGAAYIALRAVAVGQPIPVVLSIVLVLCAAGLIAFDDRDARKDGIGQ